ncbi:MAG: SDR family NAD(P)-dependent oxidoreductase [Christensenellaceae bacterium]|jgi:NAD(P)-dependent dehydrogenase (short-subunit alcohol dehydrogenase family)
MKNTKYESLKGKNVLVVGSAKGIGRATAEVFADNGVNLVLGDVNEDMLKNTAKEIADQYGIKTYPVKIDVTSAKSIDEGVDKAVEAVGTIDVLLNCAGICVASKFTELEEELWDRHMNINLKGTYLTIKKVANHMIEKGVKGKIVTISSQASKKAEYGNGAYCCSKAAINMMTSVLALELGEYGITVNCVCPGSVDTEMMQAVFRERGPLAGMTPAEYEVEVCNAIPLKRMAQPQEVGQFMAYLASDQAEYITGVALTIAGGSTLL